MFTVGQSLGTDAEDIFREHVTLMRRGLISALIALYRRSSMNVRSLPEAH